MKITNFFAVFVFDRHMQDLKQKTDRVYLTALPASVLLWTSTQTEHYHSADNRLTKCEAFSIFLLVPETQSHNNTDFALKEAEQISKLKKFIHKDNYIIENSKSANMDKHG